MKNMQCEIKTVTQIQIVMGITDARVINDALIDYIGRRGISTPRRDTVAKLQGCMEELLNPPVDRDVDE